MKLTLVQHGRLRDAPVVTLRDEYVKRFRRFGTLTIVEREPKGDAVLWPASARWKVALDEHGREFDSVAFAQQLQKWTMAHGEIAFLVGDAYGHHAPTLASADATMCLGRITLPHQLAHLVLVEQLYRAATIIAGLPYHHA